MGTRGEVYVRNSEGVIELWRHYDTYPDYMEPYFRLFAKYAAWCVGSQKHWLTYPEDVAAMLIAFDHEVTVAAHLAYSVELFEGRPDLRPRGGINDFEYVWINDIPNANQTEKLLWRVRGFRYRYRANDEEMRKAIREMQDSMLDDYLEKVRDFTVEPENDAGGCRICGYPGPLLLVENPPICMYCLIRRMKGDEFVKEQIEQILNIAPLISGK